MHFEHEGISLSYGTPDAPAPGETVQAGTEITITLGVQPIDASNRVEVRYRLNQGPTEAVAAKWLFNDTSRKIQYFRAYLPAFRIGDMVEYTGICRCAGRQVPSPQEAQQLRYSFRVVGAEVTATPGLASRTAMIEEPGMSIGHPGGTLSPARATSPLMMPLSQGVTGSPTMVGKYLSEFYTYKVVLPGSDRVDADPSTSLEEQIQAHILTGNRAFFLSEYTFALKEYLTAWGMLPRFVYPFFPDIAVKVNDVELLKVDVLDHLMAASVQVHRFRDLPSLTPTIPLPPLVLDPPAGLVQIAEKYGGKIDRAKQLYQVGHVFAQLGEADLAQQYIEQALQAGPNDLELQADGRAVLGAIALSRSDQENARSQLEAASSFYQHAKRTDGVAAMQYNLGVALTLAGDVEGAAKNLIAATVSSPASVKWQVTQSLNPGIASVMRPMGQAGLLLLVKDSAGRWTEMPPTALGQPRRFLNVVRDGAAISIDLQTQGAAAIRDQVLPPPWLP
jgi:tetratricopeptide (TPR) repeat protein